SALPPDTRFELALAVVSLPDPGLAERVCDALRTSTETKDMTIWLVDHHADLDEPDRPTLADLKLMLAGPAFSDLLWLLWARLAAAGKPDDAWRRVSARVEAIPQEEIAPPPLLDGHDL